MKVAVAGLLHHLGAAAVKLAKIVPAASAAVAVAVAVAALLKATSSSTSVRHRLDVAY